MSNTRSPGLKQLVKSVLGAALGVQSERMRQQDFTATSPIPYILIGILFVAIFIASLVLISHLLIA